MLMDSGVWSQDSLMESGVLNSGRRISSSIRDGVCHSASESMVAQALLQAYGKVELEPCVRLYLTKGLALNVLDMFFNTCAFTGYHDMFSMPTVVMLTGVCSGVAIPCQMFLVSELSRGSETGLRAMCESNPNKVVQPRFKLKNTIVVLGLYK